MFAARLAEVADQVGAHLDGTLAPLGDLPLTRAMRYACRGGKRLRAFLVVESAALHGVGLAQAIWPAAAVEALHAYSLIHDDLPAMDDDALRRGLPTVHVKWDEATAILAGDALQALAFDLVARPETHPDPAIRLTLIQGLARAAGPLGMVRGQAQDIAAETAAAPLTLAQITELQANKTGALIRWSATAGAHLAGADPAPLAAYADALGLAFQIADDILDIEGDPARTGKALRKDEAAGKATFVSLLGLDGARARARSLVDQAETALAPYGPAAQTLRHAARFVISRET
jgi:farnesyl diphosphate synthase